MKKLVIIFLISFLFIGTAVYFKYKIPLSFSNKITSNNNEIKQNNILNIYNWSDYLPEDVLKQFEQETGIHVNYSTYDNNETMYTKLKANPDIGYDIIVPSTYFIDRMKNEHMLLPLDKSRLGNFKNLNPAMLSKPFDPDNTYSMPYLSYLRCKRYF